MQRQVSPLKMLLLIFLATVSCADGWSQWGVTYEPKTICAAEGSTVTIGCSYWHPEHIKVKYEIWFNDPIMKTAYIILERTPFITQMCRAWPADTETEFSSWGTETKSAVRISDVRTTDSGYYKFRFVGYGDGLKWTGVPGVRVTVTGLKIKATAQTVKENDEVTLTSTTTCSLTNGVFWYRNEQRLRETSQTLVIQRVSYEDHGSYWCQTGVTKSPAYQLNIVYAPKNVVISGLPTICIEEGTSVTLHCTAIANPPGTYTWVKDNIRIPGSGEHLQISRASVRAAGSYHCEVTNIYGMIKSAAVTLVVNRLKIEATVETVKENDTVTLRCTTTCSLPHRVFSWYRNGHPVYETSALLVIQRVSLTHNSSYWCQTGVTKSPAFLLDVQYAPKNAVITGQANTTIEEGESVTLNCTASANPPSNYTWVKENSSHVGSGEHLKISEFNVNDAGSYHCEATNIHGTAKSATVKLTVNVNSSTNYAFYSLLIVPLLAALALGVFIFLRKKTKKTNQQNRDGQGGRETAADDVYYNLCEPTNTPKQQNEEQTLSYASVQFKAKPDKRMKAKEHGKKTEDGNQDIIYSSVICINDSPDRPLLTAGSPVKEGESTSLRCSAPFLCPKQPPSLAWSDTLNGTVHQTVETGIKEDRSVSSLLTFTTSYHLHMKDIICTVSYTVETEKRSAAQSLTLSVLYAPRETSIHHTDQIFMGQSLTLTCNASANPTANFSWFQINGASASLIGQQQEVTLVAVTPGDSGRYYCQAENLYGKDNSKPVILNVLFPPNNTTASLNYTTGIKDGDPVALICSSSANPLARYSWFKITEAAILLMGSERSLTLTAVTPSDSGRYYCQAQNSLGLENSTFVFLNVLADTKTENISFLISGICVTVVVVILVVLCVVVNSKRRSATSSTDHSPVTSAQNMKHVTPTHAFTAVYVNSQAIRNQMEEEEQDDNTQYVYIDFQRPKNVKDRTNLEESSAMTRRPPEDETLYADIKH
ncbi:LOW QUALITY PROTEIN: sialoadhesin-like [Polypterus senegalus]|uniref:LOW QUALITY PROTEIN: sialoadhesin-like n=1 Tax=Polypterus senegalus TaxID=55291 RepID=UPI001962CC3F|nr:LOW QUALITY PROTEIN: sialoadhesin-like [Polypterus senegalus]